MSPQLASTLVLLTLLTGVAVARDVTDPYDAYRGPVEGSEGFRFDESLVEKWEEQQQIEVPVLSEAGLQGIRIDHGPVGGMRFFVDLETLTVDPRDEVVRYWVVTESGGSRSNVLYEGIRCADGSFKTYAFASPRRPSLFKYARSPEWQKIGGLGARDFHHELAENYFCSRGSPRSMVGITAAVRGQVDLTNPNLEDADFVDP